MRKHQPVVQAGVLQLLIPPADAVGAVGDVLVAEVEVEGGENGDFLLPELAVLDIRHRAHLVEQDVVVLAARLLPAALEAG